MKKRNMRTTLMTLVLLLATASPLVSAANQSEEVSRQNVYSIDSTTVLSFQDVLSSGSGVEALLCGYNLERTIRGDCDGTSAVEAPGERWFRFTVPPNSIGNQMTLTVDNLGTPHYVDLSVSLCRKSNFSTSMMCEDEGDIYQDESESMKVFPVFTVEYWIKIAWDETKENREPGGDLTNVRVKLAGNGTPTTTEPNLKRCQTATNSNVKSAKSVARTAARTPWTCSSSTVFQAMWLRCDLVRERTTFFATMMFASTLAMNWISPTPHEPHGGTFWTTVVNTIRTLYARPNPTRSPNRVGCT